MDNAEINNIIKIMGFKYNKKYDNDDDLKTLRYGKVMIMTDQVNMCIYGNILSDGMIIV